jgi:hypothetical protein
MRQDVFSIFLDFLGFSEIKEMFDLWGFSATLFWISDFSGLPEYMKNTRIKF